MTETTGKFSRRQFLAYQAIIEAGSTEEQAAGAVAAAAREHPEWDLDEEISWGDWNAQSPRGRRAMRTP